MRTLVTMTWPGGDLYALLYAYLDYIELFE